MRPQGATTNAPVLGPAQDGAGFDTGREPPLARDWRTRSHSGNDFRRKCFSECGDSRLFGTRPAVNNGAFFPAGGAARATARELVAGRPFPQTGSRGSILGMAARALRRTTARPFDAQARQFAATPRQFTTNPLSFVPNDWSDPANPQSFAVNPQSFTADPPRFGLNDRAFAPSDRRLTANSRPGAANLQSFGTNDRAVVASVRAITPNDRAVLAARSSRSPEAVASSTHFAFSTSADNNPKPNRS